MIKYVFPILLAFVCFASCSKVEHDDVRPTIVDLRINKHDTIIFNNRIMLINDSNKTPEIRVDTLIIGKVVTLSAVFEDNIALSSYKVSLDSIKVTLKEMKDTIHSFKALGKNIFGHREARVKKDLLFDIPYYITNKKTNQEIDTLYIREGEYWFKVSCMDEAGNETPVRFKIKLLHRKTVHDDKYR